MKKSQKIFTAWTKKFSFSDEQEGKKKIKQGLKNQLLEVTNHLENIVKELHFEKNHFMRNKINYKSLYKHNKVFIRNRSSNTPKISVLYADLQTERENLKVRIEAEWKKYLMKGWYK